MAEMVALGRQTLKEKALRDMERYYGRTPDLAWLERIKKQLRDFYGAPEEPKGKIKD